MNCKPKALCFLAAFADPKGKFARGPEGVAAWEESSFNHGTAIRGGSG